MAEFTPTLDELRRIYVDATEGHREECPDDDERAAEFNRAIAVAVRADMQREVEWGTADRDEDGELFDFWASDSREQALKDIADDDERELVLVIRTPAKEAGPWEPATPSTPNQQGAEQ